MADLFDWMDEAEIAVDDAPARPVAVVSTLGAEGGEDARFARLSAAGLSSVVGIALDERDDADPIQWQIAFLHEFIAMPALRGQRAVRIALDDVVEWCKKEFGAGLPEAEGRDWSTSPQFDMLDRYLAHLEDAGIVAIAPNRLDFDVREKVLAAFHGEPISEIRSAYWWEQLGLDIPGKLRGNESVVASEIHAAMARIDRHWRAYELEDCVREIELAYAAGSEIDDNLEDGLLWCLEVLRNWLKWELRRRDLGGHRWDPYTDGVGKTPADAIHRRYFDDEP